MSFVHTVSLTTMIIFVMVNAAIIFWNIVTLNRVDGEGRQITDSDLLFTKYRFELIAKYIALSCFFTVFCAVGLFSEKFIPSVHLMVQTLAYGVLLAIKHFVWEVKRETKDNYRELNKLFLILNVVEVLGLVIYLTNIAAGFGF